MKKLYAYVVKAAFLLSRPLSALALHNSHRVRVVVIAEQSILLQRSSFGHQLWSLPGGGIEKNEDPLHAAARELKEETNVAVKESLLSYMGKRRLPSGKRWPLINLEFYKLELPHKPRIAIVRPHEILELKWFAVNQLPKQRSTTVDAALTLVKNA